jgi:hypothetical protein
MQVEAARDPRERRKPMAAPEVKTFDQTMEVVPNDRWPRRDPRTGLLLCEPCWNNGDWPHHCHRGPCECPKRNCGGAAAHREPKIKFTGEGQSSFLETVDAIEIKADS